MALLNKKTPRSLIKGRTDNLLDSTVDTKASASMAGDIFSQDPAYVDGIMTPIMYHTDLMQEDIDELRRYVTEDISSGGGGLTNTPLVNISGVFQWSSADDGERVHVGHTSYGPFSWYSWGTEPSDSNLKTYSAGTVDTTTAYVLDRDPMTFGIYVPDESKKVKARVTFMVQNGNTFDWGFSMWDCPPGLASGAITNNTVTLRAQSATTTANSDPTKTYITEFTTTSAVSDKYLFFLAEARAGNLTTTTYLYANIAFFLVD
jgi:hypothetical protein